MNVNANTAQLIIGVLGFIAVVLILSPVFDAREYIRQVWLLADIAAILSLEIIFA